MTYTALKTEIKERLGLTSSDADTRIGRLINSHYRTITASIGINMSRRTRVPITTTPASNSIIITNMENIEVLAKEDDTPYRILEEVTYYELQELHPENSASDNITRFARKSNTSTGITVVFDTTPETAFTVAAYGLGTLSDLTGTSEPVLPQSFHRILVDAVLIDEYMRMEKPELAKITVARFEQSMSDMRMFLAKSAYETILAGKTRRSINPFSTRI